MVLEAMSYSSHKKAALDATKPLSHRASHARSCAGLVAAKLGSSRREVIERVRSETGVDLMNLPESEDVEPALACLERIRKAAE